MHPGQFAVYQLKNIVENREIRFRSYQILQEKKIHVRYENYNQVYLGWMQPGDDLEHIKARLDLQLPRTFKGHSISVSDVLALNKDGVVAFYYVEKEGFTILPGFIPNGFSGAVVSLDTTGFQIEGKEGNWLAFDSIILEGKEFFLMEHEYGSEDTWVVVDGNGELIVDKVSQGFNRAVLQQIRDYFEPSQVIQEQGRPQNENIIDSRQNSLSPMGRESVLTRLHQKQAEIAERSRKTVQQMGVAEEIERRRK